MINKKEIEEKYLNDINDELEKLFEECVEKKEIPITIMAISSEANLILAEKLSS